MSQSHAVLSRPVLLVTPATALPVSPSPSLGVRDQSVINP
jgi:hypothetical protein